jgi:hypothetical protein
LAVPIAVQPDGPVKVGVVVLAEKNRSNASPAWTDEGMVTVWLIRLPTVAAAPTKVTGLA